MIAWFKLPGGTILQRLFKSVEPGVKKLSKFFIRSSRMAPRTARSCDMSS